MREHASFLGFQEFVRGLLANNPSATPLTPLDEQPVPATTDEVRLSDVLGLTDVVIRFHGDTTLDALKRIAEGNIKKDFILLGPSADHGNWRFHSASTHNLENLKAADGMFAYVKE
jgi:hypothetical protein